MIVKFNYNFKSIGDDELKNKKIPIILVIVIAIFLAVYAFSPFKDIDNTKRNTNTEINSEEALNKEKELLQSLDVYDSNHMNLITNDYNGISMDDVPKYTLEATLNDTDMTLTCHEQLEFKNSENEELNNLVFHIFPNAFREEATAPMTLSNPKYMYPNGFDSGYIDVKEIKINGEIVDFKVEGEDNTLLIVKPNSNIGVSESLTIDIVFDVKIPNCRDRFGYDDMTIQVANWFPILSVYENGEWDRDKYYPLGDAFYTESANYEVTFNVPKDYIVASTGAKESIEVNGDRKIYKATSSLTRDFALVASKFFILETKVVDGTRISTYTYTLDSDDINEAMETSEKTIMAFNNIFGKYPYSDLAIVETSFPTGMEYPQLVMIGNDYYKDGREYALDNVVNHEIGHQWWYGVVGDDQVSEAWLDEGLTSYSEILYKEVYNADSYEDEANGVLRSISNRDSEYNTSVVKHLSEFENWNDYGFLAYVKSQQFFIDYRDEYGKEKLMDALKLHYSKNRFKVTTTEDIISTFEEVCGEDISHIWKPILFNED